MAPLEVGGDHLHLTDQFRYFAALSHANATAAWAGFNHAGAAGMAGATLGDDGLAALFGSDPSPVMAAVAAPSGTYRQVDGGVEVTGTWKYASGVRHADWVMLTALEEDATPSSVRIAVVRTADAVIGTEWNVMALIRELVTVPDAGHMSVLDNPGDVVRVVLPFLERVDRRRGGLSRWCR